MLEQGPLVGCPSHPAHALVVRAVRCAVGEDWAPGLRQASTSLHQSPPREPALPPASGFPNHPAHARALRAATCTDEAEEGWADGLL